MVMPVNKDRHTDYARIDLDLMALMSCGQYVRQSENLPVNKDRHTDYARIDLDLMALMLCGQYVRQSENLQVCGSQQDLS